MAQRTVGSPVNIYIQEGEVALSFSLHGEPNAMVDTVKGAEEVLKPYRLCKENYETEKKAGAVNELEESSKKKLP
jgi:hypothetical protein